MDFTMWHDIALQIINAVTEWQTLMSVSPDDVYCMFHICD